MPWQNVDYFDIELHDKAMYLYDKALQLSLNNNTYIINIQLTLITKLSLGRNSMILNKWETKYTTMKFFIIKQTKI